MIRDNGAALIVGSRSRSIAEVSERLDLEPSWSHERGAETRLSRRIPAGSEPRYEQDSRWVFEVEDDDPEDHTGFGSVRKLLRALAGREDRVRELRPHFDVWIQWTGFSDSRSGGFVIPADVLPGLARLECAVMANAEFLAETDH
jgi:hypothetical protein